MLSAVFHIKSGNTWISSFSIFCSVTSCMWISVFRKAVLALSCSLSLVSVPLYFCPHRYGGYETFYSCNDFSACLKMSRSGGGVGRVGNEGVLIRLLNMSSVIQVIWRWESCIWKITRSGWIDYAGNQNTCILLQILWLLCSKVLNLVVSFKYEVVNSRHLVYLQ